MIYFTFVSDKMDGPLVLEQSQEQNHEQPPQKYDQIEEQLSEAFKESEMYKTVKKRMDDIKKLKASFADLENRQAERKMRQAKIREEIEENGKMLEDLTKKTEELKTDFKVMKEELAQLLQKIDNWCECEIDDSTEPTCIVCHQAI